MKITSINVKQYALIWNFVNKFCWPEQSNINLFPHFFTKPVDSENSVKLSLTYINVLHW